MKRNLALLFASMLLMFALTACGKDDQNASDNNSNQSVTEDSATPDSSTGDNTVTENGIGNSNDEGDGVPSNDENPITGMDDSTNQDTTTKQSTRPGDTTYGQMLRNSEARDTDGLLRDLENAVTPGSAK